MPTFEGSLQIAGDASTNMPAGIRVDGGRLVILAGASEEIGNWSLSQIDIHRKSGAFVFNAEGEQLLISVDDPDGFSRLVDINDDSPAPAQPKKERRSRKKKERPPKEPRAKRPKKDQAAAAPTEEPSAQPPAAEPKPVPSYLIEPETVASTPPPPPAEAVAEPTKRARKPKKAKKAKSPQSVSLFAALPLSWKVGGAIVLAAIALGIFAPAILTAILMLTGMVALLLAVVVGTDSIVAARLPASMTSTNTLVAGVILLVLSALMMVIS